MKFHFNIQGKKHTEELADYGVAFKRLNQIKEEKGLGDYDRYSVQSEESRLKTLKYIKEKGEQPYNKADELYIACCEDGIRY